MKQFFIIASLVLALSSCHSYRTSLSQHIINTEKLPEINKEGKACNNYFPILSLIAQNYDDSIETARKDGDIHQIAIVEKQVSRFLGILFIRDCTIVKGN